MGKSRRAGAMPQRAPLGDGQPGTTASVGSGILWASGGRAGAGVWSWALHGRDAAPEPCGLGGKQRGLGRDVPEPRQAVNSHRRRSNSSAGSQRWAFVSWKPDGALPSTGAARPAAALSQAQAPRDPGAAQHPVAGTPSGWSESWGCREGLPNGRAVSGCPLPHRFPQPAPGVSQGMLCSKGWRKQAASPRGD